MCYYDHATHLALRLDQWNLAGENGRGDAEMNRAIRSGKLKPVKQKPVQPKPRVWLRFWRNGLSLP